MLRVRVSTASAEIIETELITAGRRGLECAFEFNSAWDSLAKTVIVSGVVKRDIVLVNDTITVPGECLAREQFPLRIGVYGANGAGKIVIPTIWANFGKILPSARPSGVSPDEVTPDVVAQIQTNSSDALRLAQEVMRRADSGEFDGRDGATGPTGATGAQGPQGVKGDTGNSGVYIGTAEPTDPDVNVWVDTDGDADEPVLPAGGTTGQVLAKASGADYDTEWVDQSGGGSVEEVFWATYNTTTEAEVTAAVAAGKAVLCKISDEIFYLVSKAAIGPSGSAWLFASANQTSMRVTFVSGSYWNSISTKTIPSKTSDLTNDSGFVNAAGAAAAAPVQSVNGQTGAVTVSGGGEFLVTITYDSINDTYVSDKTFAQIKAARQTGQSIVLQYGDPTEVYHLALWIVDTPEFAVWSRNQGDSADQIMMDDTGIIDRSTSILGTYSKPTGGIPKTDLASAVQTSLGKADTALQSYTETDPTVPSWAKASSKPSYTASEVGAIAAPASPATGAFLVWNGTAWVAQTLATWQAGSY